MNKNNQIGRGAVRETQSFNNLEFHRYPLQKDFTNRNYFHKRINNKKVRLHRYVYEYFHGCIPKGMDVHHIDLNKSNNNIDNLSLLSSKEHKTRHSGNLVSEETRVKMSNRSKGENNPNYGKKISEEQKAKFRHTMSLKKALKSTNK